MAPGEPRAAGARRAGPGGRAPPPAAGCSLRLLQQSAELGDLVRGQRCDELRQRDRMVTGRRQQLAHPLRGLLFPALAWAVGERAARPAPLDEPFLPQPGEDGHHRRVGEWSFRVETALYVARGQRLGAVPQHVHNEALELARGQLGPGHPTSSVMNGPRPPQRRRAAALAATTTACRPPPRPARRRIAAALLVVLAVPRRVRREGPVPRTGILAVRRGGPMRGYEMSKDDYLKRLRRVEDQVRGLQRMIDEDTYCIDVLTQVSAVTSALQSVAVGLLDEHVRHCVSDAARGDDAERAEAMVTEATKAIERLVKS